uniref:Regulatory protein zeste n=1 Tax=Dendroctonus ponderosae TaxID=77166 RepID=A0AAR5NYL1_DENPD
RDTLLELVAFHKDVIENKKTDAVSTQEKQSTWEKITGEFNAICPATIPRTTATIRKFYNNQKEDIRKRIANQKKELYQTGGGGVVSSVQRSNADRILLSIVNNKTLYGVDNSLAPFDDDWVPKNEIPPSLIAYIPGPSRSEPINMSFSQLIRKGVDETLKFKFHENQEECSTIDNIELVYEKDDNIENALPVNEVPSPFSPYSKPYSKP